MSDGGENLIRDPVAAVADGQLQRPLECRAQALAWENTPRSISRAGAAADVLIWVLAASALAYWLSTAWSTQPSIARHM